MWRYGDVITTIMIQELRCIVKTLPKRKRQLQRYRTVNLFRFRVVFLCKNWKEIRKILITCNFPSTIFITRLQYVINILISIYEYFVSECMAAGALFIAGLIYFPDKPPTPPSYTASVKRIDYTNALGKIIR